MVILTLGLALIIQGTVVWWWGAEPVSLPFPISDTRTYKLGPVVVSQLSIATMAAGLVGSFLLYLLVQKTRLGLAMRATSEGSSWRPRCCSTRSLCWTRFSRASPLPCSAG